MGVDDLAAASNIFRLKILDRPIVDHVHPRRFRGDPEICPAVLKQINNPVAAQSRRVVLVENDKMNPVKTHQAVKRSEPEITVVRLDHGNNFVVRRAFAGPFSAVQEFTMNGASVSTAGQANAERAIMAGQSASLANRNALECCDIFSGCWFGLWQLNSTLAHQAGRAALCPPPFINERFPVRHNGAHPAGAGRPTCPIVPKNCYRIDWSRIQIRQWEEKLFLKITCHFAVRVKFALPNENWAPRRVWAI